MAFSPSESDFRLFTAGQDYSIKVWDLAMNQQVHSFERLGAYASSFSFTNDGSVFICGLRNGMVRLWNTTEYQMLAEVNSEHEEVTAILYYNHAFTDSNSKPYVLYGTNSGALHLLDVNSSRVIWKDEQAAAPVDAEDDEVAAKDIEHIFHSPHSNKIFSLNNDQVLAQYSIIQKKEKITLKKHSELTLYLDEIIDCKFLSDTQLLLCSNSETLKVFNLETNTCQLVYGHSDIIVCIDTFDDGRWFLSGCKDNTVRLWENSEEKGIRCAAVFKGHNESVTSVTAAPKRNNFFVSAG